MKKHTLLLLFSLLVIAFFLRFIRLSSAPVELFGDEIDVGIQGYSLLMTGKDYLGHPLPLSISSFSESRLPFLMYFTIPFIKIFGLTELGLRLPMVVIGLLLILQIYILGYRLFGKKVGILAAALYTISPWAIHFSRWTNDNVGILLFVLPAIYFFSKKNYLWALSLLALAFYTYSVATVFVPLLGLVLLLLIVPLRDVLSKKVIFGGIIALIILIPYAITVVSSVGSNRFSQISIFGDSTLLHDLLTRRSQSGSGLTRYFRNRPLFYFHEFTNSYLRSFSTEFLFFNGDPILRHSPGGMGMFYLFEVITIPLGLAWIALNWRSKAARLLLLWLLISPVSSALTKDGGNHAGRLIVMLPPMLLVSALGLQVLLTKKILSVLVTGVAVYCFSFFMYRYHVEWPKDSWRFWQYGFKEAFAYTRSIQPQPARIFFNSTYETALPRFLFWFAYDPQLFQNQANTLIYQEEIVPGFSGVTLENKYYFGTITNKVRTDGFRKLLRPGDVYVASYRDEIGTDDWTVSPVEGLSVQKIIYSPTGEPVFAVLSVSP